jgi:hypothetical protein
MNNALLGIIALAVTVMAILQVVVAIMATKAVKRVADAANRFDTDVRPIVLNLQQATADAARATSLAAAQVERIDRVMGDVSRHVEQTAKAIPLLIEAARDGFTVLGGLKAVINAIREMRRAKEPQPVSVDEEDALFIG